MEIRGRGTQVKVTDADLTGFGFGVKGAAEGIFWSSVINRMTQTRTASIESIVGIQWESGSLAMVNRLFTPEELAHVLAPVLDQAKTTSAGASNDTTKDISEVKDDISYGLTKLAELHRDGELTDEEYATAKRKLLR